MMVLVYFGLVAGYVLLVTGSSDNMLGDGKYEVLNIEKCDGWEQYEIECEVVKRKLNRTHDIFNARFKSGGIDDTYACQIDICKFVDGGCKPYQVLADDSFERFVRKYAEKNFLTALTMAEIEPADFPIPAGEYNIEKYMFNYDELPIQGPYGEYSAEAYLIKDSVKKACLKIQVKFSEIEEDDDE